MLHSCYLKLLVTTSKALVTSSDALVPSSSLKHSWESDGIQHHTCDSVWFHVHTARGLAIPKSVWTWICIL